MDIEIVATGDELRTGQLVDRNSAHIARELHRSGFEVVRFHCIGDHLERLVQLFREIGQRSDMAVVTGGLGPTVDDLSSLAAARAARVDLSEDATALASVEAFFKLRRRSLTASNRKQTFLPHGAQCLPNPVGTAPGFSITIGKCRFFFLPGVPFEMKRMLKDQVIPAADATRGTSKLFFPDRTLSVFGLTESATNQRLEGLADRFPSVKLGMRAKFPEIQVRLYTRGSQERLLAKTLDRASDWVVGRLGSHVFSTRGRSLPHTAGELLRRRGETLALAESCTGGLMAHWLTEAAGSSDYFLLSAVTYANQAKMDVLGVESATLRDYGAVHVQTAQAMAAGARRLAGATYGLATSGIAGPGGGTPEKPVGTVCIGLATATETHGFRFNFSYGDRGMNKQMFSAKAFDLLRRKLSGIDLGQ
jgi:nicotinamide-nucleotide amidase